MHLGIVVNDVQTERAGYTTMRLAMAAHNRGHHVWVMGLRDFAYEPLGSITGRARSLPPKVYKQGENYVADLQSKKALAERISVSDLDILLLRSDPASEVGESAWAASAGIHFSRLAMRHGVIVLNDPDGLSQAMNKMYLQLFPEQVRPRTLITRARDEIRSFVEDVGGAAIIKPLQGSGGSGVFLVKKEHMPNLNQMVESVARDGYVIVQEYLEEAAHGDTRLFLMNGEVLRYRGKYAAFRRVSSGDDIRSNVHAGGKLRPAEINETHLHVADLVRPKIRDDGMFLVGLDIVGDKLMEINVFSPGGLGSAQKFENVNFGHAVVDALERKVVLMQAYARRFSNVEMATL